MDQDLTMFIIGIAVLLSYWFSHLAGRYRIPAVVLLLAGILARSATQFFNNSVVFPAQLLPLLGTTGLVLIVLEGALDLRLEPGHGTFLLRTCAAAALGVGVTTMALTSLMTRLFGLPVLQDKLKHLTAEATFLVRTFFFLLLGYVTDIKAFLDPAAWAYAAGIVAIIFSLRWMVLKACALIPVILLSCLVMTAGLKVGRQR